MAGNAAKKDNFDKFYQDPVKPKKELSAKDCLKKIKDMCLFCKGREILLVMGCRNINCPLHEVKIEAFGGEKDGLGS